MVYGQKNTVPDRSSIAVRDLRREERAPAGGDVRLVLDQDGHNVVDGHLIDVSTSGYRALHESTALIPGKVVRFHYSASSEVNVAASKSGWARVIWTRPLGAKMESGFFVVLSE